jgi:L-ascorbate metabolism protein UlaG (beta-lactamase superfamily)
MTTLTHLGNDGILLESGERKILVDGIFRNKLERWSHLPEADQAQLEQAVSPYNGVDVVLVTHNHLDHWHPQAVGNFLKNSPQTTLVAPRQAIDDLQDPEKCDNYAEIQQQVSDSMPSFGEEIRIQDGDLVIDVLGMHHFNMFDYRFEDVQNNGYVISLDGKRLLHLGDVNMTEENFAPFKLHERDIDVVFLPLFSDNLSQERRDVILKHVNPQHVVSLHAQIGHEEDIRTSVKELYPHATIFTEVLEQVTL